METLRVLCKPFLFCYKKVYCYITCYCICKGLDVLFSIQMILKCTENSQYVWILHDRIVVFVLIRIILYLLSVSNANRLCLVVIWCFRSCLSLSMGKRFCGTAVAPPSMMLPTWVMPGNTLSIALCVSHNGSHCVSGTVCVLLFVMGL